MSLELDRNEEIMEIQTGCEQLGWGGRNTSVPCMGAVAEEMCQKRGGTGMQQCCWVHWAGPAVSLMLRGGFLPDPLISKSASLPAYRRNGLHRVSASCCSLLCIPAAMPGCASPK